MSREHIYYWKSDRPSAFGTLRGDHSPETINQLLKILNGELRRNFDDNVQNIQPGPGQGNHLTFTAEWNGSKLFIRMEDGPEKDDYMIAETRVIDMVSELGIPTVKIHKTDASREQVRFAYQIMDFDPCEDLNSFYKAKQMDMPVMAFKIGAYIARWQEIKPIGFGPFNTARIRADGLLEGWHHDYPSYYFLNLDKHLAFLRENAFLTMEQVAEIATVINAHRKYLNIAEGCLVHKDLALWNILGTPETIRAFIDWDDTISGDPTDDLSLLACFHDEATVRAAIDGYCTVRELPQDFEVRFQLHLLRNMITKAVIRVGGNYFTKTDDFFLIDAGGEGLSLEKITRNRLFSAVNNLQQRLSQTTK